MNENIAVSQEEIDKLYQQLNKDARAGGYNLNPDIEFTRSLVSRLVDQRKKIWLSGLSLPFSFRR